jgi:hypothetical protein
VAEIVGLVSQGLAIKIQPKYLSPNRLWDGYHSLFSELNTLKSEVVAQETAKISLGSNQKFTEKFDWKFSVNVSAQIIEIAKESEKIFNLRASQDG